MPKKIIIFILIIFITGIFASCNIFDWLYPDEDISGDVEDLIAKGDAALRSGNPSEAMKYYGEAIKKDSKSSEARWGYVKAYILTKNADLILIASKLVAGQDPASIISDSASTLMGMMNVIIDKLDPIAHGQCDGVIPSTDFGVNLNLMLAYMVRGFLMNGDSNSDENYFSITGAGGGDIFIFQNGELVYNPAVVDIEGLSETLTVTFDEVINSLSTQPHPSPLARSTVSNLLRTSHNIIEDLLYVYYVMGSSFSDFTGGMYALNNAVAGLAAGEVVEELKRELEDRYNEAREYLEGSEDDACSLNDDHFRIVGQDVNGYTNSCPENWYTKFTKSPWTNHSNPPNTTYAPGKTNLYRRFLNKSGDYFTTFGDAQFTNDLIFITDLTNTVSKIFRDIENSNLLKNLMGVQ